ncbi:MAG TPA: YCF48-related protein [Pyrinomonadaceae bacterium]|jgi:photosystem II stability/assembly factor-like uncharacterized protein|nr:YCF48-related protein [Pyrinomonadaceae bacterium]
MNLLLLIFSVLLTLPTWSLQTSGVNARLRGVSAVDERVAWASGSGGTVLRTEDGGATWKRITVTTDIVDFRDIDAIDETTAYVLSIGNGAASRIYKTTDRGTTWTAQFQNQDPKAFLDAMSFWDTDHGLVIGDSIDRQFYILITTNGGREWTRVAPDKLPSALVNEGAFAASGTNIAVYGKRYAWIGLGSAERARVLRTTDGGQTWKVFETPIKSNQSSGIFSIAFRDEKHGVIVGGDYQKERDATDNLAITNDGGESWTLTKGLSGFRSVVAYIPGTSSLIAVGPSGSDYSADDGHTWSALAGPGFDTFSFAPRQKFGWAAGARGAIGRINFSK